MNVKHAFTFLILASSYPASADAADVSEIAKAVNDQQVDAMVRLIAAEQELYLQQQLLAAQQSGKNEGELGKLEQDIRLEFAEYQDTKAGQASLQAAHDAVSRETFSIMIENYFSSVEPTVACDDDGWCDEIRTFTDEYGELQSAEKRYNKNTKEELIHHFCGSYGELQRRCFNTDTWQFVKQERKSKTDGWHNTI